MDRCVACPAPPGGPCYAQAAQRGGVPRLCELVAAGRDDYAALIVERSAPGWRPAAAQAPAEPPRTYDPELVRAAETCPHRLDGPRDLDCGCAGYRCGPAGRRPGATVRVLDCYSCVAEHRGVTT